MSEQITYELPLSERIRTFLRLEDLFEQMLHFSQHDGEWQNRAELSCLLDILAISSRTDLRNEITKEIERHTKCLVIFAKNPKVDREKLEQSIDQLNSLNRQLLTSSGRIDQVLGQVDLLKCLSQRNSIPGGTCDFDLPAYHFWLNKPLSVRREHLLRISLNLSSEYFAEISGGKHRFTVRFMLPLETERPSQIDEDIRFTLSICQL